MSERKSSTIREQAHHAFQYDLPDLLETHPRKWVAYYGKERLGFGTSKARLMEECIERGYKYEELYIRMVQPEMCIARVSWCYG